MQGGSLAPLFSFPNTCIRGVGSHQASQPPLLPPADPHSQTEQLPTRPFCQGQDGTGFGVVPATAAGRIGLSPPGITHPCLPPLCLSGRAVGDRQRIRGTRKAAPRPQNRDPLPRFLCRPAPPRAEQKDLVSGSRQQGGCEGHAEPCAPLAEGSVCRARLLFLHSHLGLASGWQCQHGRLSRALPSGGQQAWTHPRSLLPSPLPTLALHDVTGQTSAVHSQGLLPQVLMLKDLSLPVPLPPPPPHPGQPPPSKRFCPSVCCQKFLPSGHSIAWLCWVMLPRCCRPAGEEAPHCCRQCFAEPVTALFSKVFHQGVEQRLEQGTEKRRLPARRRL